MDTSKMHLIRADRICLKRRSRHRNCYGPGHLFAATLIAISSVFFCLQSPASAAQVSVKSEIDRQQAYVGDRLIFTLTVTSDTSVSVDSIPVGDELGTFEVKGRNYSLSRDGSRGLIHEIRFNVAAYETGRLWIPSVAIPVTDRDGSKTEFQSDSLEVTILSLAGNDSTADIKGLKPPVYFGKRLPWWYVVLAVFVVAVVLYWLIRRRKRAAGEVTTEPVDMRPPWVIAEEKLRKLRESDLLPSGEFKLFYLELTTIVRAYLEPRFGIDALDRTTYELRGEMQRANIGESHLNLMMELFRNADLVKFAKHKPTVGEVEADFQKGWLFVQETGEKRSTEVKGA